MDKLSIKEAVAMVVLPFNIKTVERIIQDREFGSGTEEQWNQRLENMKRRLRELKEDA